MTATGQFTKIAVSGKDGIAVLTLASDKVNALDVDTLGEISAFVDKCEQDPAVRALVVTGQGAIFSAGLNVGEVLDNDPARTGVLLEALSSALVRLFRFPKPTVAAINGPAIAGGCILASACDKRLIVEGARIGATELKVGVSFPVVAVELLRHACGAGAEQIMLDAVLYDAAEACRTGLVHRIVPAASCRSPRSAWRRSWPPSTPRPTRWRRPPADGPTLGRRRPGVPGARPPGPRALAARPDPGQPRTAAQAEGLTPKGRGTPSGRHLTWPTTLTSSAHGASNSTRSSANSPGCSMAAKCPPRGMVAHRVTLYCSSTHDRGHRRTSFGYRATPVGTSMKGSRSVSTPLRFVSQYSRAEDVADRFNQYSITLVSSWSLEKDRSGSPSAVAPLPKLLHDPGEQPGRRVVEADTHRLGLGPLFDRVGGLVTGESPHVGEVRLLLVGHGPEAPTAVLTGTSRWMAARCSGSRAPMRVVTWAPQSPP